MKYPFALIDLIAFKKVSSLLAGNYKTSFHGSGMEFADIREYDLGDNVSDIDWKSTARSGKVYVKKYQEDRERRVLFICDTGASMRFGSDIKTKQETLMEVFSLLLFSSAQNNDPSGAWFFGEVLEKTFRIEKGMSHIQRMIKDLEFCQSQGLSKNSSLPMVFEELCKKQIKNHLIFILTDSLDLPEESTIRSILGQNDCIMIHIFDTFENTLSDQSTHVLVDGSDIFIDTGDVLKQEQYIQERKGALYDFHHKISALGGSYLALDESKNMYEELYLFFKKRQNRGL